MNTQSLQTKVIFVVTVLVLTMSTLGFAPLGQTNTNLAASPRFHGFDLNAICRKVYQADGHPLTDLPTGRYYVYANNPKDAYSLRCQRYAGILAPQNHIDGIGDFLIYWYGSNIYGFNLYNACKKMNSKGVLKLGDSKNPWSWGCWY
jgi:hypothetical protein